MDRQTEYLIARNQVPRGQITTRIFILLIFLMIAYIAIWYFWPTSSLANLPYCIFHNDSNQSPNTIKGIFVSEPRSMGFEGDSIRELLRFYDDGLLLHYTQYHNHWGRGQPDIYRNWREMSKWFNRETYEQYEYNDQGKYQLVGDQITLETADSRINQSTTWLGTYSNGTLTLTWVDSVLKETITVQFSRFVVEECPFNRTSE